MTAATSTTRRRLASAAVVFACLALICAPIVWRLWAQHSAKMAVIEDRHAFWRLHDHVERMIASGHPAVVRSANGAYVSSFESFFEYVKEREPSAVSSATAPNPFPGILPGRRYGRLSGPATAPSQLLIWNEDILHRPIGDVQMRITCRGGLRELKDSDLEAGVMTQP